MNKRSVETKISTSEFQNKYDSTQLHSTQPSIVAPSAKHRRAFTVQNAILQDITMNVSQQENAHPSKLLPDYQLNKLIQDIPPVRRVFSKSKAYSKNDLQRNCSDGITVPHSMFSILSDEQLHKVMKLLQRKTLLVKVNDSRTFFNINMSILYRKQHEFTDVEQQKPMKQEVSGHVANILDSSCLDEDIVYLPDWMFTKLRVKEGDPICVTVDINLQQEYSHHAREVHLQMLNHVIDEQEITLIKQLIQSAIFEYKLLNLHEEMKFCLNKKVYYFLIEDIQPKGQQTYLNVNNQAKACITSHKFAEHKYRKQNTIINNKDLEQADMRALDLNEIVATRGLLDLDLIEQVLNKRKLLIMQQKKLKQYNSIQKHEETVKDESFFQTQKTTKGGEVEKVTLISKVQEEPLNKKITQMVGSKPQLVTSDSNLCVYTMDQGHIVKKSLRPNRSHSHSSKTIINNNGKEVYFENGPIPIKTIIKKNDEILNLKSMSIEFQSKVKSAKKPSQMYQNTQQKHLEDILNQEVEHSEKLSQLPLSNQKDVNLRNMGNLLLQSEADHSNLTDSFCNSYYGQLMNRKLQEFNYAKNEQHEIEKQLLAQRQNMQRPLTTGCDTRSNQRQTYQLRRNMQLKQIMIEKQHVEHEQTSLKQQLNQMALKKGRLPMSTPGVLNLMFKKYKTIVRSNQSSTKNSQVDISKPGSRQQSAAPQSRNTKRDHQGTPLNIAKPKPINYKDGSARVQLNFKIAKKSKPKLKLKKEDSMKHHEFTKSLMKPWVNQTLNSDKSNFLSNGSKDYHQLQIQIQNPMMEQDILFTPTSDQERSPNTGNNSQKFQVYNRVSQKPGGEMIEDLDKIQIENSAFKYMFKNFMSENQTRASQFQSRSRSKKDKFQQGSTHLKDKRNSQKRNLEWKLVKIQELRPDSVRANEKALRLSHNDYLEDDILLKRRHIMNNGNATLNVTSPHSMLYKREKGLKTLCHQRAKSTINKAGIGLNIQKAHLKLFNIRAIQQTSHDNNSPNTKADLVLRLDELNQKAPHLLSREVLFTVETIDHEAESMYMQVQNRGLGIQDSLQGLSSPMLGASEIL